MLETLSRPQRVGLIGLGDRVDIYAQIIQADPSRFTLCAAAEINPERLSRFAQRFDLPPTACFSDHETLLRAGNNLDALLVLTTDTTHETVAQAVLEANLPLLLEKPMAHTVEGAWRLREQARRRNLLLQIGFILRYVPYYRRLKEIVQSGILGRILAIEAKEILHFAHTGTAFQRGHYRHRADCGSFILTKCCHDFDIFNWLLESRAQRVVSFGGRDYFLPRSDAAQHCSECALAEDCLFEGSTLYTGGWQSGRDRADCCVFNADSDIVDNQSVLIEYANKVRVTFTVMQFGARGRRTIHIAGDRAELQGDDDQNEIVVTRYRPHQEIRYPAADTPLLQVALSKEAFTEQQRPPALPIGHGLAEVALLREFHSNLQSGATQSWVGADAGFEGVVVGVGADIACREQRIVDLDALRQQTHRE